MSSINVLFYSNNCAGSQTLITMMDNEGLLKYFHSICTDNNSQVPPEIKMTPTLIVKNIPTPYVAGDAFAWLSKMKQWKLNEQIKNMNNLQKQHLEKMNNNLVKNDDLSIKEFIKDEMGGSSDTYAYYLDVDSQATALQHSYFDYNNIGKEVICTPSLETDKIGEAEHKKLRTMLEHERKKQNSDIKKNIESFRQEMSRK